MIEVVGEEHALFGGECAKWKTSLLLGDCGRQSHRQFVFDCKFHVHIKKFGSQSDRCEVWCQVSDVDAPFECARNLCATLSQYFCRIGVFPQVVNSAREAAFTRQQRWCVSDRAPAIHLVFAVECEVHTNVFAGICHDCVSSPRCWHHQRCTRCNTFSQCVIHTNIGCMKRSQVIATNDHEFG